MYLKGDLDFIELSFIAQNLVMAGVVFVRREHFMIDGNIKHQLVAVAAFFSGIAFIGQPRTGGVEIMHVSQSIIFAANILGILTLFNLGKSFGVLIACRGVKTDGFYRFVRHPMYASDLLLRVGFLISHLAPFTVLVYVLSTACYAYRAILEERFLADEPEYQAYMKTVRYRFIPYIF